MYRRKAPQTDLFEDATLFDRVRLDPGRKWVRMVKLVPWLIRKLQMRMNALSASSSGIWMSVQSIYLEWGNFLILGIMKIESIFLLL